MTRDQKRVFVLTVIGVAVCAMVVLSFSGS